jgi:hypothetical protein
LKLERLDRPTICPEIGAVLLKRVKLGKERKREKIRKVNLEKRDAEIRKYSLH